jgi:hypothetical protein
LEKTQTIKRKTAMGKKLIFYPIGIKIEEKKGYYPLM